MEIPDTTTINDHDRPNRMMSELDFTKTQLAVFGVTTLLAVDAIK